MRVAYVCADPGVPVFGCKGASLHLQEFIRALLRRGAEVELFATRLGDGVASDWNDVVIHRLPILPKADAALRERAAMAANGAVHEMLHRAGPFDLVYERYSLWSFAGMQYARQTSIPGMLEVNAPLIEEQAQFRSLVDRAGAKRIAERVFGDATRIIAVSQGVREYVERFPAARGHVHVVANGVHPGRFPLGLQPTIPSQTGHFTVGFVGSLKPWHGLPILVEAFSVLSDRCRQVRLLVVGDGPERGSMAADLSTRGLVNTAHFTGAVAASEIPGLLASMDVAVAPYPQLEHFYFSPLKVYEYMAAGVPVVASRIGDLTELIEDGVNGLLCPPGDPVALAEALDCLRREPELRARLGQAARNSVLHDRTWDAVVRRILDLTGIDVTERSRLAEART